MAALTLAAYVAVTISLALAAYTNQALKDTYAGIVGTVAQKYPQAEAQVVRDLSAPDALSVNLGTQVLEKYGLGDRSAADIGVTAGLLARLLPVGLALVGLVCTGFVLLLVRYQRAVSAQVAGLSAYLRQIDAGDYALDARDNGEGSFSLLKNDLYKVTVRLREQAELLQKDKTALSTSSPTSPTRSKPRSPRWGCWPTCWPKTPRRRTGARLLSGCARSSGASSGWWPRCSSWPGWMPAPLLLKANRWTCAG
jgi:hypothetical protein